VTKHVSINAFVFSSPMLPAETSVR